MIMNACYHVQEANQAEEDVKNLGPRLYRSDTFTQLSRSFKWLIWHNLTIDGKKDRNILQQES